MSFIDIKNLVFEYFRRDEDGDVEEMVEALSDVSLDVDKGDFIAIIGENGSGKSTLAKHINALLTPVEGEVIVNGMDTQDGKLRLSIRKTAGMVFQNPDNQIVGSIVEEDIAFGPENLGYAREIIINKVDEALNDTEMTDYRTKSPDKLSGGQKQRVAIAGVLAMEPECIIFDEATSMLDEKSRKKVLELALELNREKNITILWITHHMDEIYSADKVFVLNKGKLVAQGKPMQLLRDEEIMEQCGLFPPQILQYEKFMVGQGIVNEYEIGQITDDDELVALLREKYADQNKRQPDDTYLYQDDEPDNRLAEGILLNDISYIYNKGYANEYKALKNVTLHIGKGEFIAIIGRTGSGKSTLMQHLNGLLMPDSGNVFFNGRDITDKDFPLKELRQKVGMVFQYPEYQLFAETVEQDVAFGPMNMNINRVEAYRRAYKAIEAVGLPDSIYDVSPLNLSGGQKRRTALAGVLAMEPQYLILDEPTAGLDPITAKSLMDMLKNLQENQGITVVIVSHSMEEVAEYADRVVVLENGQITMDDRTWKVFCNTQKLEAAGLTAPLGIKLLNALKNVGDGLDITRHSRIEIFGELCKLTDMRKG